MRIATLCIALMSTSPLLLPPQQTDTRKKPQQPDIGVLLRKSLREVKGCLGVENARMDSGKTSIIAWFKDVESVKTWYHNEVHRRMVRMAGADPDEHEPLQHVGAYKGPVMVIATITPTSEKNRIPGIPLPVSQISVELFQPLPGGAFVNGRLAPKSFKVPHMKNLSGSYSK